MPTAPSPVAAAAPQPMRRALRTPELVVGTRGSALARWQTDYVLNLLCSRWPEHAFRVETITTRGDRTQALATPFSELGDTSIFVAELEQALLAGTLDAAVHSLKDLPGTLDPRLTIAAVPMREDPRDVLISRAGHTLDSLPSGAVVATGSLRRRAQLLHHRPDLRITDIRGNVDTRLRKALAPDGPDAVVLALAGIRRLGLEAHVTEILPISTMLPGAGQGALAVESRVGDRRLNRLLHAIDSAPTHRAVVAERAVLAALGGGCRVPLGAHADVHGESLRLDAVVVSPDGTSLIRVSHEGPLNRPVALGRGVARDLLRQGAASILDDILARPT